MRLSELELRAECVRIAELLATRDQRIVFAESCTAGLVASLLARVPGISRHLCGSAVVYRDDTKARWLGVSERLLEEHGAVSEAVTVEMALGALARTPEANLAVAVTGHLGPDAPPEQDGKVFVAAAVRAGSNGEPVPAGTACWRLEAADRQPRQCEAALHVLVFARKTLEGQHASETA